MGRISETSYKAQSFFFKKSQNFCAFHQNIILKKMVDFFNPGSIDVDIAPQIVGIVILFCLAFISMATLMSSSESYWIRIDNEGDQILLVILFVFLFICFVYLTCRIYKIKKTKTSYEEIC